jgi:prepilin-type processing-associated H-X9-DG protein
MKNIGTQGFEKAFTRMELIAVLAAILALGTVAYGTAIGFGRRAPKYSCAENLKDLGVAMALYEKDNNDSLPYAFVRYDGTHFTSWDTLVFPYVHPPGYDPKTEKAPKHVLLCPQDPLESPDGERRRTYSMPGNMMDKRDWPPSSHSYSGIGLWWQNGKGPEMASLSHLTNSPSEAGADSDAQTNNAAGKLSIPAIRLSEIQAPAHTLLLTEQLRSNNLAFTYQCAIIRNPNEHVDKRAIQPEQVHEGKFNYLMVDGHVEPLKPLQSVGRTDPLNPDSASEHFPNVWSIRGDD